MATRTTSAHSGTTGATQAASYERFAGVCALLGGVGSILYSVVFVILKNVLLYSLLLTLGGLLASAVLVGVYSRVREANRDFALLALLLGVVAALGSFGHGAYDLANALHPEAGPTRVLSTAASATAISTLPSEIDARGALTFGLSGLALLVFSWLIVRSGRLPRGLGYLGYALGVLLILTYLGRLIVLDPASDAGKVFILAPAALTGLIVNPIWYLWLGSALLRVTQREGAAP
ncbi:MAG: hypothetical protein OJF49_002179 [Ktedonobacterales bacterium]|jgi:hypothetical protein|nr:MAG: hypothetical protein OJF49_002179 [Ktedonobacterales bacterium]